MLATRKPVKRRALTGTGAVVLLVGGGRWAAYLGASPIFLTDLLIFGALGHRLYSRHIIGSRPTRGTSRRDHPGPLIVLFAGWALIRLIMGGHLGVTALRDFAPYAYAALAIVSARAYSRSVDRTRTTSLLCWALLLHAAWVNVAVFLPGLVARLPAVNGVQLLFVRSDYDSAMLGVLAGWSIHRALLGNRRHLLVAALAVAPFLRLESRAGLIGAAAAVAVGAWSVLHPQARVDRDRQLRNLVFVAALAAVAVLLLPSSSAGARLLSVLDPSSSSAASAFGTAEARRHGWASLQDYIESDTTRRIAGVGFGPDFMHASGTDIALLGGVHEDVRSPHNYLLGTYARLGLIGAVLWGLIAAQGLLAVRRAARLFRHDPLLLICSMVVVALIPAGLLGVVLESPFGAVPFYWCLGILLAQPVKPRLHVPHEHEAGARGQEDHRPGHPGGPPEQPEQHDRRPAHGHQPVTPNL